jgi:3D (Asp-Asp-Asp) domain-containing protein
MRIISIIAVLYLVCVMIFPQHALASETIDTNIKIEFNLDSNINNSGTLQIKFDENYIAQELEAQERVKNEKVLAKWENKRKNAKLPKEKFTINASAYTAATDECGKNDGITASGLKVKENRTLACPQAFPFGTKVQIEGVGTLVCEDRGGAIKGNHFDIYVETKKEAFAFGRQNLLAEVVE